MASPFEPTSFAHGFGPEATVAKPCEVRLFGSLRVLAIDGADRTPVGRKARALLAYLLLADGEGATRDRLAALLWSERGEDQARASLRQSLYEMRALTSGDATLVASDRARIWIETGKVVRDIDRMRMAAVAADTRTLAALIGDKPPELLTDLDGIDPALDEWLVIERARRNDERRNVVLSAARAALATDDVEGAQQLAVRLLASDPTDETVARLAMEAGHRRGDRDSVRLTFVRLQDMLREDLGVAPSYETVALHERLMNTQVQSRSIVRHEIIEAVPAANDDPMHGTADRSPLPEEPDGDVAASVVDERRAAVAQQRRMPRFAMPALIALVLVLAAGTAAWLRSAATPSQRMLIVEPFKVAADDPPAVALRSGFAAELAHLLLGNDTRLDVVDAAQPAIGGTSANASGFVIDGEARSAGPLLHVDVKLRRAKDDTILWSGSVTRAAAEVDALREQTAAKVADVAVCALGSGNARLEDFKTETIRLLLGACEEKHGDWNESAKLLHQVVAMEPQFAHGWAMLAAATAVSASASDDTASPESNVNTYANKALALDPHEGEAYFAKADALRGIGRWSERMAMVHAGLAVEPTNAALNSTSVAGLSQVGRLQEAIGFSQRSVHADPFSAEKAAQRLRLLGLSGDLADAGIALQAAHRRFGSNRSLAVVEFRNAALAGDANHAAAMLADPERGFMMEPDRMAMWKALIAARVTPLQTARDDAYRAFTASMAAHRQLDIDTLEKLAMLQRIDEAYATADRLPADVLDRSSTSPLFTTVMAPLRADPRFMTLAARFGLVAIWTQTDHWPDFCSDPSLPYDCRVEAKRAMTAQARPLVPAR